MVNVKVLLICILYLIFIYIYKVKQKQNIMKDYKYTLIIAFLLCFIAVDFFESGNEAMGFLMIPTTMGTILFGYISNILEDE